MKLSEALAAIREAPETGKSFQIAIACGFTPLHFASFLQAHSQQLLPDRKVEIVSGLYGDLIGSVQNWSSDSGGVGAIVLEWSDLDARLGFRSLGGWGQKVAPGIVQNVGSRLDHLNSVIASIQRKSKIVLVPPTLPLPPAFYTTSNQESEAELTLAAAVSEFVRNVSAHPAVVVASRQKIEAESPIEGRYDLRSDLNAGFPYSLRHADHLAKIIADLLRVPSPKKGIITDLDDTLWLGLVGEIGAANVSWDLAGHSQIHGLYQQMLQALSDQGVLIAVASKNSRELAVEALDRTDLALQKDKLFPLEIHWDAKSLSVSRILKIWNIAANSVVFLDDSPIELQEVKLSHPNIECRLFPKRDPAQFLAMLNELRDMFGKSKLSEEDSYRLDSIRRGAEFADETLSRDQTENLLSNAGSVINLDFHPRPSEGRLLELVNKTNQFNLNGLRVDDAEWVSRLNDPKMVTVSIQYTDQFGPLGKIGVFQARQEGQDLYVVTWVLSCRAFSRRIEFQTLSQVFAFTDADRIIFHFIETPKNGPTTTFLTALLGRAPGEDKTAVSRQQFLQACPPLYHQVIKEQ